jgi:diguanylate cyclase (GGDEF)-like protein
MKRAFASGIATNLLAPTDATVPPLCLAYFQRRAYFEIEAARYAAYAAAGATVIVGLPGEATGLPPGIVGVDLSAREEVSDSWVLITLAGSAASALVAVDGGGLVDGEQTLESARTFAARWTFRPDDAVDACRQILRPVAPQLPPRVLARAEAALRLAEVAEPGPGEDRLLVALEVLSDALELQSPPAGAVRELERSGADLDLLTDVHNRRFLDRYVASARGESAVSVAAILFDIDDLAQLNGARGNDAGDAALIGVAEVLRRERRPGDLVVRYGDDEFLVLSPATSGEGALELAERLVAAVRGVRLQAPFEDEHISVSAGATIADPANLPVERLTDGVHLAKLLGKNLGRFVD